MSLAVADRGHWEHWGACRHRTDLFFATDEFTQSLCVRIRSSCPVLDDCRAAHPETEQFGVVAGRLPTGWSS